MMVLRRIAYTLLTLFKSVTQRSEDMRAMEWRELFTRLWATLISASQEQLDNIRFKAASAAS